jgi:putative spermidine/putrescine transport system permease protein
LSFASALSRLVRCAAYIFLLAPMVMVISASFSGSDIIGFPPSSFTTAWYSGIDPAFLDGLYVSLIVATASAAIAVFTGVPGGLALARMTIPGKSLISAVCLSPLMVPTLVIGVALYQFAIWFWGVSGVGIGGTTTGLIVGHITFAIPFVMRSVIAADARSDPLLEEASRNLGANPVQTFFLVTLPLLKGAITIGAIFAFVSSFDEVPISLLMGGGDATTLPVRIFTAIAINFGGDILAVSSLVILASTVLVLLLEFTVGLERFFGEIR